MDVINGPRSTGREQDGALRWLRVLDDLPDLVVVINADGYVDYASSSAARPRQRSAETLLGRRACELIPGPERRNCATALQQALVGGQPPGLVHRLERRDGTLVWFETQLRLLSDADQPPQVVAVSRDISVRAAVDQRLDHVADLWRVLGEIMTEAVLVLDEHGVVVGANRAAGELLDYPPELMIGKDANGRLDVLDEHGRRTSEARQWVAHSVRRRGPAVRSFIARRANGNDVRLRGRAVLLPESSDGHPSSTLVLLEPPSGTPDSVDADTPALPDLLSRRELAILRLLADGHDVREAATELGISVHTARAYVKAILRKLGVRSQLQAVVVALRAGLGDLA